jgi:hypothetical protein
MKDEEGPPQWWRVAWMRLKLAVRPRPKKLPAKCFHGRTIAEGCAKCDAAFHDLVSGRTPGNPRKG